MRTGSRPRSGRSGGIPWPSLPRAGCSARRPSPSTSCRSGRTRSPFWPRRGVPWPTAPARTRFSAADGAPRRATSGGPARRGRNRQPGVGPVLRPLRRAACGARRGTRTGPRPGGPAHARAPPAGHDRWRVRPWVSAIWWGPWNPGRRPIWWPWSSAGPPSGPPTTRRRRSSSAAARTSSVSPSFQVPCGTVRVARVRRAGTRARGRGAGPHAQASDVRVTRC